MEPPIILTNGQMTVPFSGCNLIDEGTPQKTSLIIFIFQNMRYGDTQEHPLGVYLEKESLYFNITLTKCNNLIT
jgi:hypothetical protein